MDCLKAHAQQLRPFAEARAAELQQLAAIAQRAARDGALPDLDAVPREVCVFFVQRFCFLIASLGCFGCEA